MNKNDLPNRWAYKHNAFYYRPRPSEKSLFDGKSWFRLGSTYHEALRAFADRKELSAGKTLSSIIDLYEINVVPRLKPNTQRGYAQSLARLREVMGHNNIHLIGTKIAYQYMAAVSKAKSMGVANSDLKVLNVVVDHAVRSGVLARNEIKGQVKYYGKRDGLKELSDPRYVEDWELSEWIKVANPSQIAFAGIVMLTGARKTDVLRITLNDDHGDRLRVFNAKTGKEQFFWTTPALRDAIVHATQIRKPGSDYLITNANGQCFVGDNDRCESFDRAWRQSMAKAIQETSLEKSFSRHDLRAKVGSDAENEERAKQLLNHSTLSMTRKHYRRKKEPISPTK